MHIIGNAHVTKRDNESLYSDSDNEALWSLQKIRTMVKLQKEKSNNSEKSENLPPHPSNKAINRGSLESTSKQENMIILYCDRTHKFYRVRIYVASHVKYLELDNNQ